MAVCFLAFFPAAVSEGGATDSPISWQVALLPEDARAGEAAVVVVTADLKPGWHIYPTKRPLIGEPTILSIVPRDCISDSKPMFEPEAAPDADQNRERTLQKRAVFGIPIRIRAGATGEQEAAVSVEFQACTDDLCLTPQVVELPLRFRVQDGPVRAKRVAMLSELPAAEPNILPPEDGQVDVEPGARKLIDRVDAALRRVKTLSCRVAFRRQDVWFGRRIGPANSFGAPELLQYEAPNKFSYGHSYFCDGIVMGINGETLLTEPAPLSLDGPMPQGGENVLRRFHVGVLRARDFAETARENAAVLRVAGAGNANGQECDVLEADGPAMTVRWFIARSDAMVYRIEVDARMWGGTGYRDELAISQLSLNGGVDESLFHAGPHKTEAPMHAQVINDMLPIGASAPNLQLVRVGGPFDPAHPNVETVKLTDVFRTHKATLLFLWSQRCGSCYFDLPVLQQVYKEFANKGVAVLAVHSDMPGPYNNNDLLVQLQYERRWRQWGADALSQFMHEQGYSFTMLYDPESKAMSALFPESKTRTWGVAVLIDANGNIVWHGVPNLPRMILQFDNILGPLR